MFRHHTDPVPEIVDDDSYSSSFAETDSDLDDKDKCGINKHYLANEIKHGFKRVQVEYVDPVAQKLQSFLSSDILPKESMFYILLKNAISCVDWLVKRKQNHSLQFQWDNEVLQFVESLEYHGERKGVNLLRGPGHDGEGQSSAVSGFDWTKWNWPLLAKQLVIKCAAYTRQRMEYMLHFYRVFCSCHVSLVVIY